MKNTTLKNRAYDVRMELEQADMRLAGVRAAHHLLHSDAEGSSRISDELLYPFLLVIDDALEQIRSAIEHADFVLMEVHRDDGSDAGHTEADDQQESANGDS
jgi:hypothetical protein